jgi:hypothetical protein
MNIEEIRETCLAKLGVTEGFPFGQDLLVFKVMNKMFALTGLEGDPPYVNLKCDSAAGGPSNCGRDKRINGPVITEVSPYRSWFMCKRGCDC